MKKINLTVIEKPWGKEELIELNEHYLVKRLTMLKDHRCSLQYHNNKKETIYVLSGQLRIYSGLTKESLTSDIYGPHETITLDPGMVHRMEAVENCVYLEASTPEIDDVVRLSDDYDRAEIE